MTHRTTGQLKYGFLLLQAQCDVCGKKRSAGSHATCSRKRQARYQGASA